MQRLLIGCLVLLSACEGRLEGPIPFGPSGGSGGGTGPVVQQPMDPPCVPGTTADPLPMRRLTRVEYDNTMRDLLGLTQVSGDQLPPDEKTGLFLSNLSGSVSWSMLEQYATLAEAITNDVGRLRAAVEACDTATVGEAACADRFVDQFGVRAFRRPLTTEEHDRYRALYDAHRARGAFDDGIKFVARTMLQSPHFLYHFDEDLASRLAFFLWNSTPDAELMAAAQSGALATPVGIQAQVDRMLADDRARVAIGDFHLQLFGVEGHVVPNKSPTVYPQFNGTLWRSMVDETARFSDYVIRRGDGKLKTLLTASYSVNEQNELVQLDPAQRSGILTHPAVLAGLANPDTTSPVRRGRMIRRNLMCQNLPDPPPDAPTMVPPAMGQETTRMRVTRVTSQATGCASCHKFINDVGFGFENFGPLGEWQTMDNGLPIDASGVLSGTTASNGAFNGARELTTRLAESQEVQSCYTTQWVRFALGRKEQARDNCEVQELASAFSRADGDIKALLRNIALSRAFTTKDVIVPSGTGGGSGSGGGAGGGGGGGTATGGGSGGGTATGGGTGGGGGAVSTLTVLLAANAQLAPDASVTTSDGTHRFVYQLDGNLVLYRIGGGPVWNSQTAGTSPGMTVMQSDGNLVVYDSANVPRFNTMTHGNPGAQLYFEVGGRLHVIAADGVTKLWSSP